MISPGILRCTMNGLNGLAMPKVSPVLAELLGFFGIFCENPDEKSLAGALTEDHIVAARHYGLPLAMPPPFLGVSSLNLAAPSGAAFFPEGLFRREVLIPSIAAQDRCPDTPATCGMVQPISNRRLMPSWRRSWK